MAQIKPFKGIRYNEEIAKDLAKVVTQPYDKISPTLQETYYERSPFNVIRIEKNKAEVESSPYKTSHYYFEKWIKEEVLVKANKESFCYLEQTFDFYGEKVTRKALIALGKLYEYYENVVYPHEQTLKGPKVDRLELIRATQINLGQIFMLYEDKQGLVDKYIDGLATKKIFSKFTDDDGVEQVIYIIEDQIAIKSIQNLMADKKLFIADGHHRYETALAYSKENIHADHHLMSLVNAYDHGLRILPTHRLVNFNLQYDYSDSLTQIEEHFEVTKIPVPEDLAQVHQLIKALPTNSILYLDVNDKSNFLQLRLKNYRFQDATPASLKKLDVFILHEAVLENIFGITKEDLANNVYINYKRDPQSTVKSVLDGQNPMCFLLKPTLVKEVINVALDKETMPQKSTDFYPKLLTGYVIADVSGK